MTERLTTDVAELYGRFITHTDLNNQRQQMLSEVEEWHEVFGNGSIESEEAYELADVLIVGWGLLTLANYNPEELMQEKLSVAREKYAKYDTYIREGCTADEARYRCRAEWDERVPLRQLDLDI